MVHALNREQSQALEKFLEIYHTRSSFIFQIDGKAGVGKTELTLHIIREIAPESEQIVICAPTHKACQVLRERLQNILYDFPNVSVTTCHSFLQGKLVYDEEGKQKWMFEDTLQPPDLLIIDEVSMVETSIYTQFEKLYQTQEAKILTLGDRCQLPPIEEEETLFYSNHLIDYTLKKNMRNTKKNYNQFLLQIREYILNPDIIPNFTTYSIAQWLSEYTPTYSLQFFPISMKNIPEEIWKEYSNSKNSMMLAHRTNKRNNTVQQLNQEIRKYLFKDKHSHKYTIGDRIIFTDYYKSKDDNTVFHTNDRATVLNFEIEELVFYDRVFKVYALHLTRDIQGDIPGDMLVSNIVYSLHEDSQSTFEMYDKQIRDQLKENVQLNQKLCKQDKCKGFCVHKKQTSLGWKEYFTEKHFISAPIDYAYCLSIHKSQGSTYDKTYLFLSDFAWFLNNKTKSNLLQFFKLLYVGLSRSRTKTIVF